MHSPVRVLHISGARSLSDYLQETKFGGIETFDRFMTRPLARSWRGLESCVFRSSSFIGGTQTDS